MIPFRRSAKRSLPCSTLRPTSSPSLAAATENIVAWGNLGALAEAALNAGVIAYHVVVGSEVAGDQNPEEFVVQLGCRGSRRINRPTNSLALSTSARRASVPCPRSTDRRLRHEGVYADPCRLTRTKSLRAPTSTSRYVFTFSL
jgi:hypothetical protein